MKIDHSLIYFPFLATVLSQCLDMMESRQETLSVHPMTATVTNTSRSWSHQSFVLLSFVYAAVPALDDVLVQEPYKYRAKTVTASTKGPSITNHTYGSPTITLGLLSTHPCDLSSVPTWDETDIHRPSVVFWNLCPGHLFYFLRFPNRRCFRIASVNRSDVTYWASIGLSFWDITMDSWLGTWRKLITVLLETTRPSWSPPLSLSNQPPDAWTRISRDSLTFTNGDWICVFQATP